jgi:long-chain acyl-CoA synthetase
VSAPAPTSLVELLERSVDNRRAHALFLVKRDGAWTEISYQAFAAEVDHLRAGLAGLGVHRGDRVGIISNNRLEWAVLAYACYGLGAALVPMYESQQPREWAFIAADAGLKVLFAASAAIRAQVDDLPGAVPGLAHVYQLDDEAGGEAGGRSYANLRRAGQQAGPARAPVLRPEPGDVACLLYTSGTTGEPKGVVLSHGNVVSNVNSLYSVIPLATDHRTLSFLPWAHAFGHTVELHMIIAAGASMAIAEGVDKLAGNFTEVRPTVLVAVPRVFLRIFAGVEKLIAGKPRPIRALYRRGLALAQARARGQALPFGQRLLLALADRLVFDKIRARFGGRLEFAVSGAAALAREVAEFMEALGIAVYEGYGLTETSPIVTANVPGQRKLGTVGRPLPGVKVTIDRRAGGVGLLDGEIVVRGPNVMQGYHRRPAEDRQVFTDDGGLRTGDLGRLDADGYLHITGRIKEQYKLENGKYVVPGPLEERLKLSPLVANVFVYGDNRRCNVALVVPNVEALRAWAAAQRLPVAGGSAEALVADAQVKGHVGGDLARLSAEWKSYERVRAFTLVLEDFTQQNGLLTPSLKLKRRNVEARWRAEIDALYRDPGTAEAVADDAVTAAR